MRSWRPFCGIAGLDALDGNAEPEPEDGQPGEIVEAVGGSEGQAVVAPDGGGQAAFPEQTHEGLDDRTSLVDLRASQASR